MKDLQRNVRKILDTTHKVCKAGNQAFMYRHRLSIVMVSKNEEETIAHCIDSVLNATKGIDTEIILVDSKSQDRTIEVAAGYPIRILQIEKTSQLCPAAGRHVGFLNSSGKYIQFLDADMVVESEWISRAISYLESADDSVAVVCGQIAQTKTSSRYYSRFAEYLKKETITDRTRQVGSLFGAFMISAACLKDVGSFNAYMRASEEGEIADRIRARGYKIMLLPYLSALHNVDMDKPPFEIWKKNFNTSIAAGQVMRIAIFRAYPNNP